MDWLDDIEARANAATPGPWVAYEGHLSSQPWWVDSAETGETIFDGTETREQDAVFAAHARGDVPKLCRAVRELADALGEALDYAKQWVDSQDVAARLMDIEATLRKWEHGGGGSNQ